MFYDEKLDQNDDFEFNQDFEMEEEKETRSPGWIRYQKKIK
jgi:DNA helicase-2/ATP-dependent DNA helicase PcrA